MNYDLAKELKEAGFPIPKGADEEWDSYDRMHPTLSELIEACGKNFYSLYRHRDEWQAHSNSDQWDTEISHGTTPDEAVARLWLAINQKEE